MLFGMEATSGDTSFIAWEVLIGLPLIAVCFVAAVFIVVRQILLAKGSDRPYGRFEHSGSTLRLEEMRGDPREFEVTRK